MLSFFRRDTPFIIVNTPADLPAGYRPAKIRSFPGLQVNTACRLEVLSTGEVRVHAATTNTFLSLESVRFDV